LGHQRQLHSLPTRRSSDLRKRARSSGCPGACEERAVSRRGARGTIRRPGRLTRPTRGQARMGTTSMRVQDAARPEGEGFTSDQIAAHRRMLEERVFQVETKWPHFRRLIVDVAALAEGSATGDRVVCMERSLLYGGISLFAPFFHRQDFVSVDCSPGSATERGAYNAAMVD